MLKGLETVIQRCAPPFDLNGWYMNIYKSIHLFHIVIFLQRIWQICSVHLEERKHNSQEIKCTVSLSDILKNHKINFLLKISHVIK